MKYAIVDINKIWLVVNAEPKGSDVKRTEGSTVEVNTN